MIDLSQSAIPDFADDGIGGVDEVGMVKSGLQWQANDIPGAMDLGAAPGDDEHDVFSVRHGFQQGRVRGNATHGNQHDFDIGANGKRFTNGGRGLARRAADGAYGEVSLDGLAHGLRLNVETGLAEETSKSVGVDGQTRVGGTIGLVEIVPHEILDQHRGQSCLARHCNAKRGDIAEDQPAFSALHGFGKQVDMVSVKGKEFIQPVHGGGQISDKCGMLHEADIRTLIVNRGFSATGVGKEPLRRRGEQVQVDIGLEALQGRQSGGCPRSMPQPVWRDKTGDVPTA